MTEIPTVPTAPVLGHVENVQLMQTGLWPASTGPFEVTSEKIASAIEALDCSAVRRPILKLGHDDTSGDPAVGWVDNLRTDNQGQTLVGDYRGMPAWLTATDADGISIMAAAYPDRSIEGAHNYHCTKGHIHPFVVTAVALLGVEEPAIGTLESLLDLYGVAARQAGEHGELVSLTTTGGTMPDKVKAAATTDDIRRAFYDGPGQDWDLWIREMYVDPPELIVNNDSAGTISRVSYTIASTGVVTFGEFEQVKVQYVAARAAAGDRAAAFASRAEARPGEKPSASADPKTPAGSPSAGAPTPTGEETAVAFSDEQITNLRKLAGVADDADEATILAALDQAVGEAAPVTPAPPQGEPHPAPAAPLAPVPVAASAQTPEGAIVVDAETFRLVQEQGRQGAAAAARLAKDDRDRAINAAVEAGKFPSARTKHWQTAWDKDPEGTKAALASMPANMVPVSHIGDPGDPDGMDLDAEYASVFPPVRSN